MKVIITGTTGYVGEGVMLACLDTPEIEKVLSVRSIFPAILLPLDS